MSNLPVPAPADLIAGLVPDPLDPVLTRPLALHNGRAYAAAWPRLRQPRDAANLPTLLIVRDDGLLSRPVFPADTLVRLASLPPLPADRLWSTAGLQAYCAGRRPQPAEVFAALTALFDRFIDFTGSLADQTLMCELLAAYVLATWFLPAFTTFSHLWLLGDTGAGKTRLLHLLARLSHLGAVVPPYAPTAPLRDLAALGATLAVDNADGLYASLTRGLAFRPAAATVRQGLFLAGARRDVLFPLHQRLSAALGASPAHPAAYGLTHLDAFGPRLFAAQQPPHPAVAARALFIQLLRSTDRARCLADPADPAAWPVSPRALTDDLWALSLSHLAEFPAHLAAAAARSNLVGASFQTWQPLFSVAAWLGAHGLPGLEDRFRDLSREYTPRTRHLGPQAADLTTLAVLGIYSFVANQIAAIVDEYGAAPTASADPYAGLSRADRQRAKRAARRLAKLNAANKPTTLSEADTERNSRDARNTSGTPDTERNSRDARNTSGTPDTERNSRDARNTSSTPDTERNSRDARNTSGTPDTERNSRDARNTSGTPDTERNSRDARNTSGTPDTERNSRDARNTSGTPDTERDKAEWPDALSAPPAAPLHPQRIAELNQTPYFFSASMLLANMQNQARHNTWPAVADDLEPVAVGRLLSRLGLIQHQKHRGRFYIITLPQLERLIEAYRLNVPPILSYYPRFSEATLRATLPPGSPGAPLQPPSPALLKLIGPDLLGLLRPRPQP